jgi:hypothetical protein
MRIRIGVAFALIAAIFVIWSLVEFMPAKMKSRLQPTKNLAIESTFNSRGDAPKSHPEPSSDDTLSPLPWHLVNISREMTLQPAINALSVDIEIDREINDVASLFIVPLNLRCNGQICYFGAMTDNMTGKRPGTNQWEHIGRGFVFSRWGDSDPNAIHTSNGGFYLVSNLEGDLVGVRKAYVWGKGRYTFTLRLMPAKALGRLRDAPGIWVGASVYSHTTNDTIFVGALHFSGGQFDVSGSVISFVEVFRPGFYVRPPNTVPPVHIAMSDIAVDDKVQSPSRIIADYPQGVPTWTKVIGRRDALNSDSGIRAILDRDEGAFVVVVDKDAKRGKVTSERIYSSPFSDMIVR